MRNHIRHILTAPVFDDEIKTQQAYMLHRIVWTLIVVPIPFLIYTLISRDGNLSRTLIQALFGEAVNISLLIMLKRGNVHSASIIQVSAFWLFFTITAATGNGVQSEAYLLGYGLVIVIAGILLGGRGALIFTFLSLAAGAGMANNQTSELKNYGFDSSPLSTWVVSLVLFPLGAVLQYAASRSMRVSLKREQASEEKYRLISRVTSDYTFSSEFNLHNQLTENWVAGAFKTITGYTFEEYQATGGWTGHIHPDDLEQDARDMLQLKNNQKVITEVRTITKSGDIRWVRVFAHPVWDEKENRLQGVVGAVQDITEQKEIQSSLTHERDLLQIFMDNIPDHIYFKDKDSRFVRVNQAQASFLKVNTAREAIGKSDLDFQNGELAQQFMEEEKQILLTGTPVINRIEFNPAENGNPRWISATKVPVKDKDGQIIGTMGISRDVTGQQIAEQYQQRRRDFLERVVKLGKIATESDNLRGTIIKIWHGVHDVLEFDRLVVFLYNLETHMMDDTFGTDNNGQMEDNWHLSLPITSGSTFEKLLENPEGYYFSENYDQEDDINEGHDMFGVKYFVAVSASAGKKPVAVICADNLITQRPISSEQLEALRLYAGYAGLAIENSRLHEAIQNELQLQKLAEEKERDRRAILEKVIRLGQSVTEVSDLRTTLINIWHGVRLDLGFDRTGLYLYNPARGSMDGTFGTNNEGEMLDEWNTWVPVATDQPESAAFRKVLENPNALYLTHNYEHDYQTPQDHIMSGVKDFAAIAAWAGEKPMAVICVDNHISDRSITTTQIEALRLFAGYAGLGIENARLHESLQNELTQQKHGKEREEERRAMLEKVVRLGQQITEVSDLRTTLTKIWHGVHHDLDFDRVGIHLYNPERDSMDGTFGTNNNGEIVDEWHTWYSMKQDTGDRNSFLHVFEKPDTIFLTQSFEKDYNIPSEGHTMSGVTDHGSIGAWAGDKPVAVISVDNRITHRQFTEEQLEALRLFTGYVGLAIENARLNSALENELAMRKNFIVELEAKNAELERFSYTVSHDLKSPLVTIRGFLGYLERDAQAGNFEKFRSDVQRIETAVEKMQNLLRDLLELSRIGRLMNSPIEIPFDEIVKDALEIVDGQIKARNVLIDHKSDNVIIKCDRVRITEVLQNLIDNATKFMGDQPNPLIEIGSTVNDKYEKVFYVKDNGIGIAPEFHEKVFGLFDKLTAESDGTGIGLALVKRIVEVHGGRIWIESQVGSGTTFYFTLPVSNT